MSAQTTLDDDAPIILDATCSFKHIRQPPNWPPHPTLRMDVRDRVDGHRIRPDIQADARFMPLRSSSCNEIDLDPPHMIRGSINIESIKRSIRKNRLKRGKYGRIDQFTRYGFWKTRGEWHDFVSRATEEAARVCKPDGEIHFKITDPGDGSRRQAKNDLTTLLELKTHMRSVILVADDRRPTNSHNNGAEVHFLTMKPKLTTTKEAATPADRGES